MELALISEHASIETIILLTCVYVSTVRKGWVVTASPSLAL